MGQVPLKLFDATPLLAWPRLNDGVCGIFFAMTDKEEFKAGLEKLSDKDIRSTREYMSQRKKDWANEVLENRARQRFEELERSNKSMRMESLDLARKESKSSITTNRIMIASALVAIAIAALTFILK